MIINSKNQSVVVGFLCKYDKSPEYKDGDWITITGTITKGDYYGDIPIVEINDISKAEKPSDEFVYPPDDDYVPTAVIY